MEAFSFLSLGTVFTPNCYIKDCISSFELILFRLLNYLHIHWPVKVGLALPPSLMEGGGTSPPLCNQALFNRISTILRIASKIAFSTKIAFSIKIAFFPVCTGYVSFLLFFLFFLLISIF